MSKRRMEGTHTKTGDDSSRALERVRQWFGGLTFGESREWIPAPPWATFYLEIGAALSSLEESNKRFVLAISVPTRAYAAMLVAAGYVSFNALVPTYSDDEHLQQLQSLEIGTPVIFYSSGSKTRMKAKWAGTRGLPGDLQFVVKTGQGEERWIQDPNKIQISERETIILPKHQTGRRLLSQAALLESLLDSALLLRFTLNTRVDCVVIGQMNLLEQESQTILAHKDGQSQYAEGHLQDLVRTHEITRTQKDVPYRSRLLPSRSIQTQTLAEKLSPSVVVFDGASGFVKWNDVWNCTNQVVILDRAERDYEEGVRAINSQYAERLEDSTDKLPVIPAPAGIEMILYRLRA